MSTATATRTIGVEPAYRSMKLDAKKREVTRGGETFSVYRMPVSSEYPVDRYDWWEGTFYREVLSHAPGAVDLERASGAAVRDTHYGPQPGVVDGLDLESARLFADVRFSKNPGGQELERDVNTEIKKNVSIRYQTIGPPVITQAEDGVEVRTFSHWRFIHLAFEPDPADPTVGPTRSAEDGRQKLTMQVQSPIQGLKEKSMGKDPQNPNAPEDRAAPAAPAVAVLDRAPEPKVDRKAELVEIQGMCERNTIPMKETMDWLGRGLTPDQVAREILAYRHSQANPEPPSEVVAKGRTKADAGKYRYRRAAAIAAGLIRADGIEAEYDTEIRKRLGPHIPNKGGFFVPTRLMEDEGEDRALDTKTVNYGAELVQQGPAEFVDMLRNEIVLARMGARLLANLSAPVPFVIKTGAVTIYWLGQGATVSRSDQKFVTRDLTPKRLSGSQQYGRELLVTSSWDVEQMTKGDMATGHSLGYDQGGLTGVGGAEPLGLLNIPTIQTQSMGNAVPTFGKLTGMPGKTAKKNALNGRLGFAATPEIAAVMQATPRVSGAAAGFLWNGPLQGGEVAGYPAMQSNQLPITGSDHGLIFGPFDQIVMGMFGALELIVDPYTGKREGMVEITTHQLADVLVVFPEAFVSATGARLA
jgi:HK97 family phage major capsid protein